MLVWGGVDRGAGVPDGDGAAYNPATDTWRALAPAPAGISGVGAPPVWTGTEAVFFVGNSPDGPAGIAAYNPTNDDWTKFEEGPLGIRSGAVSAWTGTEMIIVGGASGDMSAVPKAAALNPKSGQWRDLPALDAVPGLMPTSATWTGKALDIAGSVAQCNGVDASIGFNPAQPGCGDFRAFLGAFDPISGTLTELDAQPTPGAGHGTFVAGAMGWTGTELVFWELEGKDQLRYFNPATNTWRFGTAAPCPDSEEFGYFVGFPPTWIGDRLAVTCTEDSIAVLDPATDSWSTTEVGSTPLSERAASAVVWSGRSLVVWSGIENKPYNPAANDGAIVDIGR